MSASPFVAIILAGGQSERMGRGDKALQRLGGLTLIERVASALSYQVAAIAISANGESNRFSFLDFSVLKDAVGGLQGPLAGIHAGMIWARKTWPKVSDLVSVPCDTPFLPGDLVERLDAARNVAGADLAVARDASGIHPVIGLWPVRLADELETSLTTTGVRALHIWIERFKVVKVDFSNDKNALFNVNTREDLLRAEAILQTRS